MSISFVFVYVFFAMDLLNGHIAAVPATEAAVSLKLWRSNYVKKVQATFCPFFSFSACNTHTGTQNNTYTWFIFGFVAVVHGLCVWKNVAAWEPCGNHTRLPPAHLRVMGKTVTKNNRERSHPVLTSTTLMFSLNLAHYFWIQKLHRKHWMTQGK